MKCQYNPDCGQQGIYNGGKYCKQHAPLAQRDWEQSFDTLVDSRAPWVYIGRHMKRCTCRIPPPNGTCSVCLAYMRAYAGRFR